MNTPISFPKSSLLKWWACVSITLVFNQYASAQDAVQVRMFGHLESVTETHPEVHSDHAHDGLESGFSIGEHDMFVTAKIGPISFLSETVVGPASSHGHGAAAMDSWPASSARII